MDEIAARLQAIERQLDANAYRVGAWRELLAEIRKLPRDRRLGLAADVNRVSDRLHLRRSRRTLPFGLAIGIALLAAAGGALLLRAGLEARSDAAVIAAAIFWGFAFQPLLKVGVGRLFGVRYSHAYVYGVPRFKMRHGAFLAAPRWTRIAVHLSGTLGSPLGIYLVWRTVPPTMPLAERVCAVSFWATLFNVSTFFFWLAGMRRLLGIPLRMSSGGAAAEELLEAIGR
jgi:hypothetical protein